MISVGIEFIRGIYMKDGLKWMYFLRVYFSFWFIFSLPSTDSLDLWIQRGTEKKNSQKWIVNSIRTSSFFLNWINGEPNAFAFYYRTRLFLCEGNWMFQVNWMWLDVIEISSSGCQLKSNYLPRAIYFPDFSIDFTIIIRFSRESLFGKFDSRFQLFTIFIYFFVRLLLSKPFLRYA